MGVYLHYYYICRVKLQQNHHGRKNQNTCSTYCTHSLGRTRRATGHGHPHLWERRPAGRQPGVAACRLGRVCGHCHGRLQLQVECTRGRYGQKHQEGNTGHHHPAAHRCHLGYLDAQRGGPHAYLLRVEHSVAPILPGLVLHHLRHCLDYNG